ncbi:MAG TPA: fumarylacetoacetate hydrolase family protein [Anaerolineaceae bacterium]|nr:fumarylacetoacetate hydrolase family protein [Anaerolineaceae bacterium]
MRFVRYTLGQSAPAFGWLIEDRIGPLDGSPFDSYRRQEATIPLSSVRLLAPVMPGKIICIGRNYVEHAREHNAEVPETPPLFLKPPSSVIGPGDKIILPPQSQQVEHEGELAVVIGRRGRWIPMEQALDYVLGYTIGNDVTARDLQRRDGQWTRGKGFDTFCPLGTWIDTDFDPADALLTCRVNAEIRQMATIRDMVFTIPQLITFISSVMTLEPGDVILTGTPAGVGPMVAGDTVTVEIEGLGELKNPVSA